MRDISALVETGILFVKVGEKKVGSFCQKSYRLFWVTEISICHIPI